MNVVLFGAGASIGQAGEGQPPLTGDLYNALKKKFPKSWGGDLPVDVEKLLANPKHFEAGIT